MTHPRSASFLTVDGRVPPFADTLAFIIDKADFPPPDIDGKIQLQDNVTYFIGNNIDLQGARLIGGINSTIIGGSSENCIISSTGLTSSLPIIYSSHTLHLRHLAFRGDYGFELSGSIPDSAYDWTGVNFIDCDIAGKIVSAGNFILDKCALLNCGPVQLAGPVGTVSFNETLFNTSPGLSSVEVLDSADISRRFRIIYSSFITLPGETSVFFAGGASVPTESYILDTVNFSGGGTYLSGVNDTSNSTLFTTNTGIANTSVNGQMYVSDNELATTVSVADTFYKVQANTTASLDNSKYGHSNNRLTCEAVINRKYLVNCQLSFESGNNNICEFGFYDSKIGVVRLPSRTKSTANSAGRAESVSMTCVVNHSSGDYIELHCSNLSATNNITVTDFTVTITSFE